MTVLVSHPYLAESSALLALALVFIGCLPRSLSALALLGGGLAVPFSLLSVVHVPSFWDPEVLWSSYASLEDALWCAAAGINAWVFALWAPRHRVTCHIAWPQLLRRYLALGVVGLLLHLPVLALLPGPSGLMPSTLFAMLGCGALVVFWLHPSARRFVGLSALAYSLFHWLDVRAFFHLWPETRSYWNPAAQLPISVFGVPAHEVLWSLCFGLSWPAMMAFITDVRLVGPGQPVQFKEKSDHTAA